MKNFPQLKHGLDTLKEHYEPEILDTDSFRIKAMKGYGKYVSEEISKIFNQEQYNEQGELTNKKELEQGLIDFFKDNHSLILRSNQEYSLTMDSDITLFLINCAKFCDSLSPLRILYPAVKSFSKVLLDDFLDLEDENLEKVLSQHGLTCDGQSLMPVEMMEFMVSLDTSLDVIYRDAHAIVKQNPFGGGDFANFYKNEDLEKIIRHSRQTQELITFKKEYDNLVQSDHSLLGILTQLKSQFALKGVQGSGTEEVAAHGAEAALLDFLEYWKVLFPEKQNTALEKSNAEKLKKIPELKELISKMVKSSEYKGKSIMLGKEPNAIKLADIKGDNRVSLTSSKYELKEKSDEPTLLFLHEKSEAGKEGKRIATIKEGSLIEKEAGVWIQAETYVEDISTCINGWQQTLGQIISAHQEELADILPDTKSQQEQIKQKIGNITQGLNRFKESIKEGTYRGSNEYTGINAKLLNQLNLEFKPATLDEFTKDLAGLSAQEIEEICKKYPENIQMLLTNVDDLVICTLNFLPETFDAILRHNPQLMEDAELFLEQPTFSTEYKLIILRNAFALDHFGRYRCKKLIDAFKANDITNEQELFHILMRDFLNHPYLNVHGFTNLIKVIQLSNISNPQEFVDALVPKLLADPNKSPKDYITIIDLLLDYIDIPNKQEQVHTLMLKLLEHPNKSSEDDITIINFLKDNIPNKDERIRTLILNFLDKPQELENLINMTNALRRSGTSNQQELIHALVLQLLAYPNKRPKDYIRIIDILEQGDIPEHIRPLLLNFLDEPQEPVGLIDMIITLRSAHISNPQAFIPALVLKLLAHPNTKPEDYIRIINILEYGDIPNKDEHIRTLVLKLLAHPNTKPEDYIRIIDILEYGDIPNKDEHIRTLVFKLLAHSNTKPEDYIRIINILEYRDIPNKDEHIRTILLNFLDRPQELVSLISMIKTLRPFHISNQQEFIPALILKLLAHPNKSLEDYLEIINFLVKDIHIPDKEEHIRTLILNFLDEPQEPGSLITMINTLRGREFSNQQELIPALVPKLLAHPNKRPADYITIIKLLKYIDIPNKQEQIRTLILNFLDCPNKGFYDYRGMINILGNIDIPDKQEFIRTLLFNFLDDPNANLGSFAIIMQGLRVISIPELLHEFIEKGLQIKRIRTLPHEFEGGFGVHFEGESLFFLMETLQGSDIPNRQEIINEILNALIELINRGVLPIAPDKYKSLLQKSYIPSEYLSVFLGLLLKSDYMSGRNWLSLINILQESKVTNKQALLQECIRSFQENFRFCSTVEDFEDVILALCKIDDIDIPQELIRTFLLYFLEYLGSNEENFTMGIESFIFLASNLAAEEFNAIMGHTNSITPDIYLSFLNQPKISVEYKRIFLLSFLNHSRPDREVIVLINALQASDFSDKKELLDEFIHKGVEQQHCDDTEGLELLTQIIRKSDTPEEEKKELSKGLIHRYFQKPFEDQYEFEKGIEIFSIFRVMQENDILDENTQELFYQYIHRYLDEKSNFSLENLESMIKDIPNTDFSDQQEKELVHKCMQRAIEQNDDSSRFETILKIIRDTDIPDQEKKAYRHESMSKVISKKLKSCHNIQDLGYDTENIRNIDIPDEEKKEYLYQWIGAAIQMQEFEVEGLLRIVHNADMPNKEKKELYYQFLGEAIQREGLVVERLINLIQNADISNEKKDEFLSELFSIRIEKKWEISVSAAEAQYVFEIIRTSNIPNKEKVLYELTHSISQKGSDFFKNVSNIEEGARIIRETDIPEKEKKEWFYEFIKRGFQKEIQEDYSSEKKERYCKCIQLAIEENYESSRFETIVEIIRGSDNSFQEKQELFHEFMKRGFKLDIFKQEDQLIELGELIKTFDMVQQKELITKLCGSLVRSNIVTNTMSTMITNLLKQLPINARQSYLHHKDNVVFLERLIEKGKCQQAIELINLFYEPKNPNYFQRIKESFCLRKAKPKSSVIPFAEKTSEFIEEMKNNKMTRSFLNVDLKQVDELEKKTKALELFRPIENNRNDMKFK